MSKQRLKYTIMGVGSILLIVCLYIAFFTKKTSPKLGEKIPEKYAIALPDTISAGTRLCIDYKAWMQGCELIIENSWGIALQKIVGDGTIYCIDDSTVRQTGLYDIYLNCAGKVVGAKQLTVTPLGPAQPLEVYLGSKSITADGGKHWAMITAIPVDSLQNPVSAGTEVAFDFYRPKGNRDSKKGRTVNLIAYQKIYSGKEVGKTIVGSKSGPAIAQEKVLLEEAGYPTNFLIKSENVYPFADSRQFFTVKSSEIADEFGNKVANGTLVTFHIIDSNGLERQLTAYSIDGRVSLNVQNPQSFGNLTIIGTIFGGISSNEISLNFERVITELPVNLDADKQHFNIGPLVGPLGQFVADGSEVEVRFNPGSIRKTVVILDGSAKISTKELPKGLYTISFKFGGFEKIIKFSK